MLDFGITAGLRYKAPEHPLLIVEEPYETNEQRKKFAELLFEKLHFPDSERSMNPKVLFPIRSEIDINSPYTTRESIMERSRKVDSALQEVIREEKAQFNQICTILGLYSLIKL